MGEQGSIEKKEWIDKEEFTFIIFDFFKILTYLILKITNIYFLNIFNCYTKEKKLDEESFRNKQILSICIDGSDFYENGYIIYSTREYPRSRSMHQL